jgi:hypothetical protein
MPLRKRTGTADKHGTDHLALKKRADARGMRTKKVVLKLGCLFRSNSRVRQRAKPRRDAVHSFVVGNHLLYKCARRFHARFEIITGNRRQPLVRNGDDIINRER